LLFKLGDMDTDTGKLRKKKTDTERDGANTCFLLYCGLGMKNGLLGGGKLAEGG